MDWDNLRYFLELARAGTLVGAARRLAVDHTTVARRLQALEKQVGSALFAREAGGHRLTEAGRALLPQVEAMEAGRRQLPWPPGDNYPGRWKRGMKRVSQLVERDFRYAGESPCWAARRR